ncbi:MAG: hypothetical protein HC831_25285 [Chloroflexia bacterium]|nr:hypothetical protein [Chloroflexia bacterium]
MTKTAEFEKRQAEMSNEELIERAEKEGSEQLPCDCIIGFECDIPITFEMCENCKSKI